MAARVYGRNLFFLLAQVVVFLHLSFAQGTTTPGADTTNPATDTPGITTPGLTTAGVVVTTAPASVTQQQQTTANVGPPTSALTTAAPPDPGEGGTVIEPNTDLGKCFCDLTANACDVNCCCDGDCSTEDLSSFTTCIDTAYVVNEQLCFRSDIIFKENIPEIVNTSDFTLFCIVIDNNEARNYYNVPEVVDSLEQFTELANSYGSTSFAPKDEASPTYANFYKAGDSIYTVYKSLALGMLGLPGAGYSSLCDDSNLAAFLMDQQTSCVRQLTDLATDCDSVPFLSALTFYEDFKLVPTPSYLANVLPDLNSTRDDLNSTLDYEDFYTNGSLVEVRLLEPVLCLDETGYQADCGFKTGGVPSPSYGTQCTNVLLEVAYTITHNSSGGIELIDVQLVLGNLSESMLRFQQTFSVAFVKADEGNTFLRSGNPGYVVGMPVLAGNLVRQVVNGETRFSIELSSDRNNWLTVIKSTADGSCETNPDIRTPVNFGEDLRTGCMIRVTFSDTADRCSLIQEAALNAMNGIMRDYVATFGNSDVETVGDWVPVIVEDITGSPTSSVEGSCINMVMSLHIEVIYANAGSLANPQAKILGVRYNYAKGSRLKYTCSGVYCQTGAGTLLQNFEITTSVAFVDTSISLTTILAEDPGFEDKLPHDFFYPFTRGGSSANQLDATLLCLGLSGYFVLLQGSLSSL